MVSVDQAYMVGHMKNADGSINNKNVVLDVYKRQVEQEFSAKEAIVCFQQLIKKKQVLIFEELWI